jgi:hypothetical protein
MFCPQCGFRQASDDVQYCSNCGFPLKGVQQLLASGGTHPLLAPDKADMSRISPRRRAYKQGWVLWMIGALIVPLLAVADAQEELIGFFSILLFVGGFLRLMYAKLFLPNQPSVDKIVPVPPASYVPPLQFSKQAERASLAPPASSIPQFNMRDRRATGELIPPPSVTDHTTRLLHKDE